MSIEVKVPVLPESVSDATIAAWHKKPGDAVKRDENLLDLETDKVVLEVPAPVDGVLKEIRFEAGATVTSQQVIAVIEEAAAGVASASAAVVGAASGRDRAGDGPPTKPEKPGMPVVNSGAGQAETTKPAVASADTATLPPGARFTAETNKLDPSKVQGTGRGNQVTKEDLVNFMRNDGKPAATQPAATQATATQAGATPSATALNSEAAKPAAGKPSSLPTGARVEERVPMTRIRARIAERLMQSKNSIAMLTSFNEVNLKAVVEMRKAQGEAFEKANGVKLGFMSFFVKAAANALQRHPVVNASVDGNDVIYHGYADISIAVSTEKGLVTPVLRNADSMGFAEIEKAISDYAKAAREGKLKLEDLQGGTFTITNGGTFGSLFSTPIVNPPQSAILGMHAIKERAIVENGVVIAAPMMYIAISYDHRIIDGKDAVLFLVDIKNQLENPQRMLLGL